MIDRIDHPMVLTTNLDALTAAYRALGFAPTPPSDRHVGTDPRTGEPVVMGTSNRHVVFAHNSIELLGLHDRSAPDPWGVNDLIRPYEGIRSYIFGCTDAAEERLRLAAAHVPVTPLLELRRPVDTADGVATMHARMTHILPAWSPEGGIGIAEHLTVELVRQPRHRQHPNGATALASVTLVVPDDELDGYRNRYQLLLDVRPETRAATSGPGATFTLAGGAVHVVPATALDALLPGETAPVLPYMAALTVSVADLAAARDLIAGNGVTTHALTSGFFARAADAGGSAVIFAEERS